MAEWAYNPITGNLDRIGDGGGPGGDITISGDSGTPLTGDTFAFVGQEANGVPVMDVDTSTGDVVIANNTWQTQYVVDPSSTAGLKGTFTTWQDAIDKAVADGATVANGLCQNIFIRPGFYPEDPVVPDTAFLNFIGLSVAGNINGDVSGAVLQGNLTFDPTVGINAYFENIAFTPATGDAFNVPDGMGAVALKDCTLQNGTAGNAISINLTDGTIRAEGCSFLGPCADSSASFIRQVEFDDCTFTDTCTLSNGAGWIVEDCQCVPFVCDDTSTLQIINGKMLNGVPWVSGTTTGDVVVKGLLGEGATEAISPSALISTAGGVYVADIAFKASDESFPMNSVYGTSAVKKMLPSMAGNIINSKLVAADYQMLFCDSYIGVTDTSAARTITLPVNPVPDAYYIVKDESFLAATNNITVAGTIDGQTDFVIAQNGGFLIVKADANGDFVIIGNSSSSAGNAFAITGPQIDFTQPGTTVLFIPEQDFFFYGYNLIGINLSGLASLMSYNIGFNSPLYDNLISGATMQASQTGYGTGTSLGIAFSEAPIVPAGTPIIFNITTEDSTGTSNLEQVNLLGYYVNGSGGGGGSSTPQPWIDVPGTTQAMAPWKKYVANNAGLVTFSLPATAAFGTEIEVMGNGAGGWIISQAAGQSINYGIASTTIGVSGSIASDDSKDSVRLVCVVANTTWNVASSQGNITVS